MSTKMAPHVMVMAMSVAIAILAWYVGLTYWDACPCHPLIPIFLITYGFYVPCLNVYSLIASYYLPDLQPILLYGNLLAIRPNFFSLLSAALVSINPILVITGFVVALPAISADIEHDLPRLDEKDCTSCVILTSLVIFHFTIVRWFIKAAMIFVRWLCRDDDEDVFRIKLSIIPIGIVPCPIFELAVDGEQAEASNEDCL